MKTNTSVLDAPQTTPAPAKPAGGLRRVSFAKPAKKEETKSSYPVFADPAVGDQVAAIAARIKTRSAELETLQGALETDKAELKQFVAPFYFKANRGHTDPPSSVAVNSSEGEVLVTFQNRYSKLEGPAEAAVAAILGDQFESLFRQAFTLKIKGDQLPSDHAQEIVDELQAVLTKYNALGALDISDEVKPVKEFHDKRHTLFTPEQNLAIERACPITAMVKTKGRNK